jgi:hypothetical protein
MLWCHLGRKEVEEEVNAVKASVHIVREREKKQEEKKRGDE